MAEAQQSERQAAPPAAREVPAGSATTTPNQRRTMEAVRIAETESITLDGRLDEDIWMRAVPATNFIQMDNADMLYMGCGPASGM